MKVLSTFLLLLISGSAFCQTWYFTDCNSVPFLWCHAPVWLDTVNAVDDPGLFAIDSSDSTSVWTYAQSHKMAFDSVSTFSGWITDSIASYGTNLKSKLELAIPLLDDWSPTWLLFEHKFDATTGSDGGYLEYSCDHLNWDIVNGNYSPYPPEETEFYQYLDLPFGQAPMLHDTIPAFYGSSTDWLWSGFQFTWFYPVMQGDENRSYQGCFDLNDTLWVRFVFESDSIAEDKAGWMIRNMVIGGSTLVGAIDEYTESPINIFPNPTSGSVQFQLPEHMRTPSEVVVYDMLGSKLLSQPYQSSMDVSGLSSGNYLLAIKVEERTYRQLLVVQ